MDEEKFIISIEISSKGIAISENAADIEHMEIARQTILDLALRQLKVFLDDPESFFTVTDSKIERLQNPYMQEAIEEYTQETFGNNIDRERTQRSRIFERDESSGDHLFPVWIRLSGLKYAISFVRVRNLLNDHPIITSSKSSADEIDELVWSFMSNIDPFDEHGMDENPPRFSDQEIINEFDSWLINRKIN